MEPKRIRESVVKRFGDMLRRAREDREWSQQGTVNHLRAFYGLEFNRSSLAQWEAGTVAAPDPGVLWALANSYGEPIETWCHALVIERTGKALEPEREAVSRVSQREAEASPAASNGRGRWPTVTEDVYLQLLRRWWSDLDEADHERVVEFVRATRIDRLALKKASGSPNG